MEILVKFLILDNKWQRKSQPQSQPSPDAPQQAFCKQLMKEGKRRERWL